MNSDSSFYTVRFDAVTQTLQYAIANNWVDISSNSGVSSINTLTGAVTLAAGTNVTLVPSGQTITINSTSSGITQLTGGVTAGPGSGSQAATVVSVGGVSAANVATGVTNGNNAVLGRDLVATMAGTGTVTPDASTAEMFTTTVTGNLTVNGPSSPVNGQKIILRILNDGSHSVTLATGAGNFRFGTDITSYTNSVSLTDYIGAAYNSAATRWDVVSIIQGF